VPSSAIVSIFESMPGSVHGNVLGILMSLLGVYLGVSGELTLQGIVTQAGSVSSNAIGS
jgi:hypothetical protein